MKILKKEVLEFSQQETDALNLTMKICTGLIQEANDPDLKALAKVTYERVAELWGWEE